MSWGGRWSALCPHRGIASSALYAWDRRHTLSSGFPQSPVIPRLAHTAAPPRGRARAERDSTVGRHTQAHRAPSDEILGCFQGLTQSCCEHPGANLC